MLQDNDLLEISHKQRDIQDLANFLSNRPGSIQQALYCMLIGAGASASSGIRTGQELIKKWRKQVLKKYVSDMDIESLDEEQMKQKLQAHYSEYDIENEYSSLFGKIYDLPSQRRNFIEQEVAKATSPSIGYQYLNLLAQEKFIETFFTTNFDDLLELSLTPLKSLERPIVCAQDSSISNISITSHRTKIIKLHGDFLYNDLRSASSETESLEINMKAKFTEFLKNYGLIVLGYAGNDKSIMEVLNNLLEQNKEFLNNGLYWCIRKSDFEQGNISSNVKNLLKKDKVFYVLIDGFDEFCADLTHKIFDINGQKPVLLRKTQERQFQELEDYYNSQKEKFADNLLILNDIKNCISEETHTENNIVNLNNKTNTDLSGNRKFEENSDIQNDLDSAISKDIKKMMTRKEYQNALDLLEIQLNSTIPSFLYNFYALLKIECQVCLKQTSSAIETIDRTITYNNKNQKDSNLQLLMEKSLLAKTYNERIQSIQAAIDIDPNNYTLWNRLAEEKTYHTPGNYSNNKDEILHYYEKSLTLNSNADNDAYSDRIDFLKRDLLNEDTQQLINICENTIQILETKDPFSTTCLKAKLEKINAIIKKSSVQEAESLKEEATFIFDSFINNNKIYERNIFYIDMYLKFCSKNNLIQNIENIFNKFDNRYSDSILYIIRKARIYLSCYRNLQMSLSILENVDTSLLKYSRKDRDMYFYTYLKYLLYDKQYKKAYDIFNEHVTHNMKEAASLEAEIIYNIDKSKFLDIALKEFEESNKNTQSYISYTYDLLKLECYDKIYDICKEIFGNNNTEVDINHPVLRINYSMAKKLGSRKSKITKTNLESVFQLKDAPFETIAAYLLMDEKQNAEKMFKEELKKDYRYFYYYQTMPVFQSLDFESLKLEPITGQMHNNLNIEILI